MADSDNLIVFLAKWAINSVVLLILSVIFRNFVVLGNASIAGHFVAVFVALILTALLSTVPVLIRKIDFKMKDERFLVLLSAIVLMPVLWAIKSLAIYTGLGIKNNVFVILISITVAIVQYFSAKYLKQVLQKI
ncbi:MAG: hypothetical protein AAB512_01220 [Patescibacteria group bacterium]